MTGFGAADGSVGNARASVEIRTVNHRFFAPNIKFPQAFAKWESDVRELLRKRIQRGYVSVVARIEERADASAVIDERHLARYLGAVRELKERHGIPGEVDMAALLRLPNVLAAPFEDAVTGSVDELAGLIARALDDLVRMRQSEGAQISRYVEARLAELKAILARIGKRAPVRLAAQHAKLRETVAGLLADHAVDDQRLAQEVAILAEKLDVAEEIDRFEAHIAAFAETIRATNAEPVGKRLGFLLQEMVREANTLGSKANDAPILTDVILLKEELERMREQVENVE